MFQKILIAAAATLIAGATIATSASATAVPKKDQKPAAEKKYCLQFDQATGTRINRSECKTKADWKREGVDVDKLARD